jgi:hypothetical protein
MLHKSILPDDLIIPAKLMYLGDITIAFAYLVKFETQILSYEYVIFLKFFCSVNVSRPITRTAWTCIVARG